MICVIKSRFDCKLVRPFIAGLIALGLNAAVATAGATDWLTAAEEAAGWKPLFDGATLRGWEGFKRRAPGSGWTISDGELTRTGDAGDLVTVDEFGDFELSLEWKIGGRANSGILYRVGMNGSQTYETGPEYQLLDDAHVSESTTHLTGALYDLIAPTKEATRPVGEWNESRIVVRGWKIQHWLNGEKIVDCDLASPGGRELVSHSKFAAMPLFATLPRGHIALQDHGGYVSFRDIKIRELH
jgi:hypothetical protein